MLANLPAAEIGSVTGPGRQRRGGGLCLAPARGAVHPRLSVSKTHLGRLLIIDTARRARDSRGRPSATYAEARPFVVACFEEPPRVAFWYEAGKPQRYRHERRAA
ncbi:MAG: hypothetical protein U0800_12620 [Isosphaeraceae bacterium]